MDGYRYAVALSVLYQAVEDVMDIERAASGEFVGRLRVPADEAFAKLLPRFRAFKLLPQVLPVDDERVSIRAVAPRKSGRPSSSLVHLALLLATIVTTLIAGNVTGSFDTLRDLLSGWPFAVALLSILGGHELGHYTLAHLHGTRASLPYFIPFPSIIGTMGAVIKMQSPIRDRRAMLDIGIAGPIVSFVLSIPVLIIGLRLSEVVPDTGTGAIWLGDSLAVLLLAKLFGPATGPGQTLMFHPVALAGWVGLWVTSANLLPVGQFDGGHIMAAAAGPHHRTVGRVVVGSLLVLGLWWVGWFIWAGIMLFIRLGHPPPLEGVTELDPPRKLLALAALVILVLTFVPVPFSFPGLPAPISVFARQF